MTPIFAPLRTQKNPTAPQSRTRARRPWMSVGLAVATVWVSACAPVDGPDTVGAPAASSGAPHAAIQAMPSDAHTSRNALDWAGTYSGVMPCASCEGIKTVITLKPDGSYTQTSNYLGRDTRFTETGRLTWDASGSRITLSGTDHDPSHFLVGEQALEMLNQDGSRVTGPLASHYRLQKQP